ncbi:MULTISPECIES: glycine betaine ABC transporter substrate-binding protein [unclassified Paenibacillus]|uniref:glycine betaine ABC transporter substrate-binding protein n=1 Tax=unclassified Paenibacillus TaxID=185978 RepID=UPI001E586220|nr:MULTISPECIES: glycine betaine ABC transporter substrate-binding protein [unclassified Paenibacillus]CAH0122762.1 Choline-binding protein [Paenibacillus sp. CECT 9249]
MNRTGAMQRWCAALLAALLAVSLPACGNTENKTGSVRNANITVGSKNFTENIILAHMMADLIENRTGLTVNRKMNLGGSNVAWTALKTGDIQIYPEYTGTIVTNYYQEKTGSSEETLARTRELLKRDRLQFLEPFGFNNTYILAVRPETAEQYQLKTYSDLAKVAAELDFAVPFDFLDRPDGYPGLQAMYQMKFKRVKGMDQGIMYRLIGQGDTDVVSAYSTDGQVDIHHLTLLQDDKHFFPPYDAGPVVREDLLNRYPEIADALAPLKGAITEEKMREMNVKVDIGHKADVVAREFLVANGLISEKTE